MSLWGWLGSCVCHLVILGGLALMTWTVQHGDRSPARVAQTRVAATPSVSATAQATDAMDPRPTRLRQPDYRPRPTHRQPTRRPLRRDGSASVIGINTGAAIPLGDFGLSIGVSRPHTEFFETTGNAYRICYVVDNSGSTKLVLEDICTELKRSIAALTSEQSFHVLFFIAGPPLEGPADTMVAATPENRQRAIAFIDAVSPGVGAGGQTQFGSDPSEALHRALLMTPKPDLIYLMSEGDFPPGTVDRLLPQLSQWTARQPVTVNAVGFFSEFKDFKENLRRLARQHGGQYRFVSEDQLFGSPRGPAR